MRSVWRMRFFKKKNISIDSPQAEHRILSIATKYKNKSSLEFVSELEKSITGRSEKSYLFLVAGNTLLEYGYLRLAEECLKIALMYLSKEGDQTKEAHCLNSIACLYRNLGQPQQALDYYEKSRLISKSANDKLGESVCIMNIGITFREDFDNPRRGMQLFEESIRIKELIGDRSGEARCLVNLGIAADYLGEFEKALEYFEKALYINKENGDKSEEAKCLMNIGVVYCDTQDFKIAREYIEDALGINLKTGDKIEEGRCYQSLSNVYSGLGDFDQARKYAKKSTEIKERTFERR